MRRREFIKVMTASAAAWPLAARAQKRLTKPTIGFLHSASPGPTTKCFERVSARLREVDFGTEKGIRWKSFIAGPKYRFDRLFPALARDLVQQEVSLIAVGGGDVTAFASGPSQLPGQFQ